MDDSALIRELHSRATGEVEAIWQNAQGEADRAREESVRAIAAARGRASTAAAERTQAAAATAALSAEADARRIRTAAKAALAARLYALARAALPAVRDVRYPALFAALASQLPARRWQTVSVNPADQALAAVAVPGAAVACDPAIDAGLIVAMEEGRIRVDNTMRMRLELAWPDLQPRMMRDVFTIVGR